MVENGREQPLAPSSMSNPMIEAALASLRAWAAKPRDADDSPAQLVEQPPEDDAAARLAAPEPAWGAVSWQLPPSYRAFLAGRSSLLIKWGENSGHDEFIVFGPQGIAAVSGVVYLEEGIYRERGQDLSTNHFVPFASGGDDECAFCFDVTAPDAEGEYPVYFNHQDDPRARYVNGGAWEDPENETPDFPSFAAWLKWVADELSAGRELDLPHSRPSSYREMSGRRSRGDG